MGSISKASRSDVTIGLDPHPGSHTASAVDHSRGFLDELTVNNSEEAYEELMRWAKRYPKRRWAIEGPGNRYVRDIVEKMLVAGETVYGITPSMTSLYRGRRTRGKDDEIDATNAARALLANEDLPEYEPMPYEAEMKELSRIYKRLSDQLKATKMSSKQVTSSEIRQPLERVIATLESAVAELKAKMRKIVQNLAPELLSERGVGTVVCSTVLAEAGRIARFPNEYHFASYCGAAPIRWQSGAHEQMRVNPGGNRRLNWAAHIVALSRLQHDPRTQAYRDKKLAEGKTQREVLRLLKTHICRDFYRILKKTQTVSSLQVAKITN